MTIRRMMIVVALVALGCGLLAAQRDHLRRWEARRVQMDLQRDMTQAMFSEAMADVAASDLKPSDNPDVFLTSPGTARWSIVVRKLPEGREQGPDRARVSGGNGEFSLKPILIEIQDPLFAGPLLGRLSRVYRERGWNFEVVRPPIANPSGR